MNNQSVISILENAGWPIYLILASSFIAFILIIERALSLRYSRVLPGNLTISVIAMHKKHELNKKILNDLDSHSLLGYMLAGIIRHQNDTQIVQDYNLNKAYFKIYSYLTKFISGIAVIASISPLLGLFGSVIGIINIFGVSSSITDPNSQLAHGISMALYNTAAGLVLAIICLIFHRYFKNKANSLMDGIKIEVDYFSKMIDKK